MLITVLLYFREKYLKVKKEDLFILGIYENRPHPNSHIEKAREGFSLYGMLDKTCTSPGKQLLKSWFQKPLQSISSLNNRYDAITFLLSCHFVELQATLRRIKVSPWILKNIETHRNYLDFFYLKQFLQYFQKIRGLLLQGDHLPPILSLDFLALQMVDWTEGLWRLIEKTINFEESKNFGKIVVNLGVDEELDKMQSLYMDLPDFLLQVAQEIYRDEQLANLIPDEGLNVVYFPQLGFLTVIPNVPAIISQFPLIDMEEGKEWLLIFSSEKSLFMKNTKMNMMDASIGDVYGDICDRELEIVEGLINEIKSLSDVIKKCLDFIALLDCLVSFAKVSKEHGLTRPFLVKEPIFKMKNTK